MSEQGVSGHHTGFSASNSIYGESATLGEKGELLLGALFATAELPLGQTEI